MFSRRVPAALDRTPLAAAVCEWQSAGRPYIDLTRSNPTRVDLQYPDGLLDGLAAAGGYTYEPHPLGLPAAREAVAAEYARRGVRADPAAVVLTASSSESYSFLFKLLCEPGDAVLIPQPSYPLFGYLTDLDGIEGRPYRLSPSGKGWSVDVSAIEDAMDARVRAVVIVAPNNPTGTRIAATELRELGELCTRRGVALIGDEVFADYELAGSADAAASVLAPTGALTVSLGGLSKSVGLPQLKLGWIALGGPSALVSDALARLEVIADAYLSVSTPIQLAAPDLLARGAAVRAQIADRVLLNYRVLMELAARYDACRVPPVSAGWSAVVQAPAVAPDDVRALGLLEEQGVLVHPGYLFEFGRDGYFVVSLLGPAAEFEAGMRRVFDALNGT